MSEIEIFQTEDGAVELNVQLENETVWLNQAQMVELFGRDKSVISRHIRNIYATEELSKEATVAKNATVQQEGGRVITREIDYYNLDMIISVGYRVNSKRGIQFRQWATQTLKQHLVQGYTLNQKRLQNNMRQFEEAVGLIKQTVQTQELTLNESKGLLDVITGYAKTWFLLQKHDENDLPQTLPFSKELFVLDYPEATSAIAELKRELMVKGEASDLFGREKAGEFEGIIRNIYQTFGGDDLIVGAEAKAAHLLYYIIKDHPFNDGNKRIGAFMFILFLAKNDLLYEANGTCKINDNALTALALLIAQSDPKSKELMIALVVSLVGEG